MFQILNWVCLICICFLVLEIMIYFCKDAIKLYHGSANKNHVSVGKAKTLVNRYNYQEKIAK